MKMRQDKYRAIHGTVGYSPPVTIPRMVTLNGALLIFAIRSQKTRAFLSCSPSSDLAGSSSCSSGSS